MVDVKAMDVAQLRAFILEEKAGDAETLKLKEQAITQLCELLVQRQEAQPQAELLSQLRGYFASIPKAKTAKIVRNIIDSIAKVAGSTQLQVRMAQYSCPGRKSGS